MGVAFNVGGGSSVTVNDVLAWLAEIIGRPVYIERQSGPRGDAPHTAAATDRARTLLGWQPRVSVRDGLSRQVEWQLGAAQATAAPPA